VSIANDLCKIIGNDIDRLPVTEFEEIILDGIPTIDADLGIQLDQKIDVFPGHDNSILHQQDYDHKLLGSYTCMSSPGVIRLYQVNITRFFWSFVRYSINNHRLRSITKFDLKNLLNIVVLKTYYHELFHFNCDVFRKMFCSKYNPLLEESLAVSYSHHRLSRLREDGKTSVGRSYAVLYNIFMRRGFEFVSPGYKDWRQFEGFSRLSAGLVEYVQPGDFVLLRSNGIDINEILFGMIRTGPGPFHEQLA